MTEFRKWALDWNDRNEIAEDLKSFKLDLSQKDNRIKTIKREITSRLSLILNHKLESNVNHEIGLPEWYSEQDYESIREQNEVQKEQIKNDIKKLEKEFSSFRHKERNACNEYVQSGQDKEQIEISDDFEDMDIKDTIEISLLQDEYYTRILEYSEYIEKFRQIKDPDEDIKGKENKKNKIEKMEKIKEKHIDNLKSYSEQSSVTIEFLTCIDDDEIKLFELLLSNIERKDIDNLKKGMWEVIKLEVREQIVALLYKIAQNKENPNRKVWRQYIKIDQLMMYLLHPVQYRIDNELNYIRNFLQYNEVIEDEEYLKVLLNMEKFLKKAVDCLEKFDVQQNPQIANIDWADMDFEIGSVSELMKRMAE